MFRSRVALLILMGGLLVPGSVALAQTWAPPPPTPADVRGWP